MISRYGIVTGPSGSISELHLPAVASTNTRFVLLTDGEPTSREDDQEFAGDLPPGAESLAWRTSLVWCGTFPSAIMTIFPVALLERLHPEG